MIRNKVITDAGRVKSGFADENNDCTVRALAKAGNMGYAEAHKIMAEEERKPGHPASVFNGIVNANEKNLLNYKHVELAKHERVYNGAPGYVGINNRPILVHRLVGPNIKQFVERYPRGRYILRIKKHVFAVIDGVMYDKYKQHGWSGSQGCMGNYPLGGNTNDGSKLQNEEGLEGRDW